MKNLTDIITDTYTDTYTVVQGVPINIHTIFNEFIGWYSVFGSIKFEPDMGTVYGSARVNSLPAQVPEYQDGDTNWDVGFACVFDY